MNIKVGDIVLYKELTIPVRIMAQYTSRMKLSHFGLVNGTINNLTLVKSVVLPELKVDDLVIINDITKDDKDQYLTSWRTEHEDMVHFDTSEIELVKSVTIPKFKNNDLVIVCNIPDEEKRMYGCSWDDCMDRYIGKMVRVRTHTRNKDRVQIEGWYFHTYHLELVRDYDIV